MTERAMLAGDMLAAAVRAAAAQAATDPLSERPRTTGLDPQSIAEFLAYDIPFEREPSLGFVLPPEVERD